MTFKDFLKSNTIGSLLATLGITIGFLLLMVIIYFYIYLPNITNHGETIEVPDLRGMTMAERRCRTLGG